MSLFDNCINETSLHESFSVVSVGVIGVGVDVVFGRRVWGRDSLYRV
jgi:hypothetical protein